MSTPSLPRWTSEQAAAHAARCRLTPAPDAAELERLCRLGDRVAAISAAIARMPFKVDEPASIFKVPL